MTVTIVVWHVFFSNGICPSSVQADNPLYCVYANELEEKLDFSKKKKRKLDVPVNRINILFYKVCVLIKQNVSQ